MRELTSTVTVDRSDRLRSIPDTRHHRDRTVHLRFLRLDDGYLVQAWGSAFPPDGGGCQGRVLLGPSTVEAGVGDLLARWRTRLIEHVEPGVRPTRRPFVDGWDLAGQDVDEVVSALARAGHDLFALLFRNGDAGLKELCDLLLAALRTGEHVVTVESDNLFVPWGLLYVPLDDHDSVWDDDYRWDPRGFWGYRHLVEHNSSRSPGSDSRIAVTGSGVAVGLNGDGRVDAPCLIVPRLDLPHAFLREYRTRLSDAFLVPGTRLGDVVRDLARAFLDEHRNPLGLVFSPHRGIDAHLADR
ncbi:hypothetical protein ADK67_12305 [Saccharothrix sp. NRRL B-16348]|uniref:hypothetical protein n=1 Tax=Saccharothrix sp. NRRL B-16348 TaxID=1415542 RepID=UPI0006AF0A4A|nr:hypothetical protein [Saccharothrix sp. NRRL B-16348]KOX28200.1 hypothetical protein ADK67_12305 [Saccharothrix sp. NRRL B-16348]